jgi:hypothetical protein
MTSRWRKRQKRYRQCALLKLEKIEDLDKKNSLVRKDLAKDYKTEVSMGLGFLLSVRFILGKVFLSNGKKVLILIPIQWLENQV